MDVLANCAGMVVLAPAEDLTSQIWDTTLAVNLTGTFLMSQQVGRAMLEAGGGKIINIASQAASVLTSMPPTAPRRRRPRPHPGAGHRVGLAGITVNAISPTVVLTDLGRKAWDGPKGDAMRSLIR